ncbi:MAG: nucleotidyltransferase domain-containing protein [Archaeoglobi archaeon]|nr:nucleotidyltransferase domain-containing protein [Candidatus Mnemosynella sp.]MBC7115406.1 nucleotidyltransferase domain-containing protein [Candidatus Mnemosynella bozhongmuii]
MIEYYERLKKNRELFERAEKIASEIKKKAKGIFEDAEVYITGSYARGEHTLSSDLDILIVSERIPEKFSFEFYRDAVIKLTDDPRVNIHLVNRRKFAELKKLYSPLIPVW